MQSRGICIFDTWNTQTILKAPPQIKQDTKTIDKSLKIERYVTPSLDATNNICHLNYKYNFSKKNQPDKEHIVQHKIKLFSQQEIKDVLKFTHFKICKILNNIIDLNKPTEKDRYICYVIQKI